MTKDKAKIREQKPRNMDYFTTLHLRDLYGLNPNSMPLTFQFPRIPPTLSPTTLNTSNNVVKKKFVHTNTSINTKLEDFQQMFQKYAAGLFDMTFPGLVPPGHPMFTRHFSIKTLQIEKDQLLKENLELKKQVEKLSKQK